MLVMKPGSLLYKVKDNKFPFESSQIHSCRLKNYLATTVEETRQKWIIHPAIHVDQSKLRQMFMSRKATVKQGGGDVVVVAVVGVAAVVLRVLCSGSELHKISFCY